MRIPVSSHFATLATALPVAILCLVPTFAHAQTYYSNLASFDAAATTTSYYDFEGIAPTGDIATNPDVLTIPATNRITFAIAGGEDTDLYASDSAFTGGYFSFNGTDTVAAGLSRGSDLATTTISLDNSYTAFGIDIAQTGNFKNNYTIGLYNGSTQVGTDHISGLVGKYFYGVTSKTAFDTVRILTANGNNLGGLGTYTVFDNARVGSLPVVVPEANTFALALPALAMIGAVVVRRRIAK